MSVSNVEYISSAAVFNVSQMREYHEVFLLEKHDPILMSIFQNEGEGTRNPFHFQTKSSCVSSLISGIAASVLTTNPLPSLLGFWGCLPRVSAQQKIGSEFQVNTNTLGDQLYPSVTDLSNGNFVVIWNSGKGQHLGQLFAENTSKINGEFHISTYLGSNQRRPSLASFSNGNFGVTWGDSGDGSGSGIFGKLFTESASGIGNQFQVNTYTNDNQYYPSITSLSNGNFVVTWSSYSQDSSDDGVFGQLFAGNASKIGNEFLVNTRVFDAQRYSSVTSVINDNFVVTWVSSGQDGSNEGVFGQLFSGNTTKIGNEFQVNTYTDQYQNDPSISFCKDGNFIIVWASLDGGSPGEGIFGQLFNINASKIGNEFRVNTYNQPGPTAPSVTCLTTGNFVVAWSGWDQNGFFSGGVVGQLFASNATKIGNEFQVNTYTNGTQSTPSVTSLSNGNFVVTWVSDGQVGPKFEVFGQLFNDRLIPSSSTVTTSSSSTTTSTFLPSSTTTSTFLPSSTTTSTFLPSSTTTSLPSSTTTSAISSSSIIASTSTFSITSGTTFTSSIHSKSATFPMISSSLNNRLILWISVGAGGLFCFCVTSLGYFLLKKRKQQVETHFSDRSRASSVEAFELEPVVQRHKIIGQQYYQISSFVRDEAKDIYLQTGHLVLFSGTQKKQKYVIASGTEGKMKVAQRIATGQYVASMKVTGEENIRLSQVQAEVQQAAAGDNVCPIYDSVRTKKALYHFMPLCYGDGIAVQRGLALLNQLLLGRTILQFIAHNLLTGLKTIHGNEICHLDIRPENLVFTREGTVYIANFHCAKRLRNSNLIETDLGDDRYFSPERLQAYDAGKFHAKKADLWAAGVTLLQIFYNQDPLQLFDMPSTRAARIEKCDQTHFAQQLKRLPEGEKGSIWWVIRGLLDVNPKRRLTAKEALQASCFDGSDITDQEKAFRQFRKAILAYHAKVKETQVDLRDYEWIAQVFAQEESKQESPSTSAPQFFGYSLQTDFSHGPYQFTPSHVTAGSSSSSGYQLTP